MPNPTPRILVVEDEAIVALDIEQQLAGLGYEVVATARTGEDACRLAEQQRPDLVLMDIHLAGAMTGIDAATQIHQTLDVPVVFLTAYSDAGTLESAKQAEPHGYVVKPFEARHLHSTLQMALYKSQLDNQLQRSHDDLRAILDAQRQGTVMLAEDGTTLMLSQAAKRMTGAAEDAVGRLWTEALGVRDDDAAAVAAMAGLPQSERDKLPALLPGSDGVPVRAEIEVVDDPRAPNQKILFLYDVSQLHSLRRQVDAAARFENMLGRSKPMLQVFQLIGELGRVDSTVLIEGETGTGKELVARAIHQQSRRREGPFVALNCAGLSEDLAASQLFGHRRGAFTGAVDDQKGLFEAAAGGSLFLDEIGELPMRIQTKLLRVLEEKAVMRVGEATPRSVDARVIAATHRNLPAEVQAGRFREDLLYRVRVGRVHVPTLRERRDDLPLLIRSFLAEHSAMAGKEVLSVAPEAMEILLEHTWPGNVRELKNSLEFALIRARGSILEPFDLPPEILESVQPERGQGGSPADERDAILAALDQAAGNRKKAAELLGMSRATLYRRLADLRIQTPDA